MRIDDRFRFGYIPNWDGHSEYFGLEGDGAAGHLALGKEGLPIDSMVSNIYIRN
jgi:hypothetical protein